MKKVTKDSKKKKIAAKDLSPKKDVKGGTGAQLTDKGGNIAGWVGKVPVR